MDADIKIDDDYDIVAPAASPMIESMRAHGYSPATAIADIIDNSISAGAKNVWIKIHWAGSASYVSVLDDGCGMDESTLRNAMRLGSRNPLEVRDAKDLGRFGLGLKTASFSQCRRLTVASRRHCEPVNIRRWDLDYLLALDVNDWRLLKKSAPGSEDCLTPLNNMDRGTIVLWEVLDRLVPSDTLSSNDAAHERFLRTIQEIKDYLSMVFHRYLEGSVPALKIFVNGQDDSRRICAWDPFMETHPSTQRTPVEQITHPDGDTFIQGFVLPHKDKLTEEEATYAAGYNGWNSQQGFYVYRNRRLLVGGGWLGIGSDKAWTQEEHYRLARIRVDIPNSQDMNWQIDVKKSTAKPPTWLRDRLKALAEQVRKQAREVFVHRGSYNLRTPGIDITRAWLSRTVREKLVYQIDRTHPLVSAVSDVMLTDEQKRLFEAMLRTIEETIPAPRIWLDTAERPEVLSRPFETADDLERRRLVELVYRVWRDKHGLKPDAARQKLLGMDCFQDMVDIIDLLED